jgi:predicted dehydrogenase
MKEKLSGGAKLDLHLHHTDAIRYYCAKPKNVTSFGSKGHRSDSGIDHVITNYNFDDDLLVVAEGGWTPAISTPFEMSFQIVGEKATVRLSETGYKVISEDGTIETPTPANPKLPTGWHVELDYFVNCIIQNKNPYEYITIEEMLDSLNIVEAERESVIQQKTVEVIYG